MRNVFFTRLKSRIGSFRRRESGAATVEFALIFPAYIFVFLSAFEVGLANIRMVMIERASDLAVRALRLNTGNPPSYNDIKTAVCNAAGIIPECMDFIQIELQPVSTTTWNLLDNNADCIDRASTIDPVVAFSNGQQNELMIVRVCAVVDPIFPAMGMGLIMPKDETGGYRLVASTAFVNEPD